MTQLTGPSLSGTSPAASARGNTGGTAAASDAVDSAFAALAALFAGQFAAQGGTDTDPADGESDAARTLPAEAGLATAGDAAASDDWPPAGLAALFLGSVPMPATAQATPPTATATSDAPLQRADAPATPPATFAMTHAPAAPTVAALATSSAATASAATAPPAPAEATPALPSGLLPTDATGAELPAPALPTPRPAPASAAIATPSPIAHAVTAAAAAKIETAVATLADALEIDAGSPSPRDAAVAPGAGTAPADAPDVTPFASTLAATAPAPRGDAAAMLHTPVVIADPQAADELAARLSWMADQRIGRAELKLSPEGMGPLEIRMRLDGDRVFAEFHSANADVRQALEAQLPRLREMLSAGGFQLAQADVGQGDTGRNDGRPSTDHSGIATDMIDGENPVAIPAARRGLLDLYA